MSATSKDVREIAWTVEMAPTPTSMQFRSEDIGNWVLLCEFPNLTPGHYVVTAITVTP